MEALHSRTDQIKTALLLAAGTGSRLQPLTDDSPKCLTEISNITILERLVRNLCEWNFERLVVVVGHLDACLRRYLDSLETGLDIQYVMSERYRTTNNVYSLWKACHVIQEPFLLIESDLIFDKDLLDKMLTPDRIAISHRLPWMNGTTVSLDHSHQVTRFHLGEERPFDEPTYKTVNMYSFSQPAWCQISRRLEQTISAGHVNGYYEAVFAEMVAQGELSFEAVFFDEQHWYEVDRFEDIYEAEQIFPSGNGWLASDVVGS